MRRGFGSNAGTRTRNKTRSSDGFRTFDLLLSRTFSSLPSSISRRSQSYRRTLFLSTLPFQRAWGALFAQYTAPSFTSPLPSALPTRQITTLTLRSSTAHLYTNTPHPTWITLPSLKLTLPSASTGEVDEHHQISQATAQAHNPDSYSSCGGVAKYVCIFLERAPDATGYPLGPTHWCSVECSDSRRGALQVEVCEAIRYRRSIQYDRERGRATEGAHRTFHREFVMEMGAGGRGPLSANHIITHEKRTPCNEYITGALRHLHVTTRHGWE